MVTASALFALFAVVFVRTGNIGAGLAFAAFSAMCAISGIVQPIRAMLGRAPLRRSWWLTLTWALVVAGFIGQFTGLAMTSAAREYWAQQRVEREGPSSDEWRREQDGEETGAAAAATTDLQDIDRSSTASSATAPPSSDVPRLVSPQVPAEKPAIDLAKIEGEAFIISLDVGGVEYGGDKETAIAGGRITCEYIDNAAAPSLALLEAVQAAQESGYTRRDAEYLVGSAIGAFCGEYRYLVN
ncbi:DUF732 domain-containing protein [Rhodococcus spongiicola]|nr:DUF732 domain-containing protein [Rhodococcus spongiicola]